MPISASLLPCQQICSLGVSREIKVYLSPCLIYFTAVFFFFFFKGINAFRMIKKCIILILGVILELYSASLKYEHKRAPNINSKLNNGQITRMCTYMCVYTCAYIYVCVCVYCT